MGRKKTQPEQEQITEMPVIHEAPAPVEGSACDPANRGLAPDVAPVRDFVPLADRRLSLQERIAQMRQRLDEDTRPQREQAERNQVEDQAKREQEEKERQAEADRKDREAKEAAHTAGVAREDFTELDRSPVEPRAPGKTFAPKSWWVRIAPYVRLQIEADTEEQAAAEYRRRVRILRVDLVPEVKPVEDKTKPVVEEKAPAKASRRKKAEPVAAE